MLHGNRDGVGVWLPFGIREVTKTLGFATIIEYCTALV